MHWRSYVGFIITMLAVTNPLGNLAIFIGLTADKGEKAQRKIALSCALASGITFVVIIWFGDAILNFMGITLPAFQLAGGLVITLLGLAMMHTETSSMTHTHGEEKEAQSRSSIAVVPMAIPIIAGPAAITTILVSVHKFPTIANKFYLSVDSMIIAAVIGIILFFSTPIRKVLGVTGINIAVRIMGLVLIAMAMEMLISGIKAAFPAFSCN